MASDLLEFEDDAPITESADAFKPATRKSSQLPEVSMADRAESASLVDTPGTTGFLGKERPETPEFASAPVRPRQEAAGFQTQARAPQPAAQPAPTQLPIANDVDTSVLEFQTGALAQSRHPVSQVRANQKALESQDYEDTSILSDIGNSLMRGVGQFGSGALWLGGQALRPLPGTAASEPLFQASTSVEDWFNNTFPKSAAASQQMFKWDDEGFEARPELFADPQWLAGNIPEVAMSLFAALGAAAKARKLTQGLKWYKGLSKGGQRAATTAAELTGAGAAGGAMEGAGHYAQLLDEGYTPEQAANASGVFGIAVGALNALSANRFLNPTTKSAIANLVINGATEGVTEGLEAPAAALTEKLMLGKEIDWKDVTAASLNEAAIAALVGGGTSAGIDAARKLSRKKQDQGVDIEFVEGAPPPADTLEADLEFDEDAGAPLPLPTIRNGEFVETEAAPAPRDDLNMDIAEVPAREAQKILKQARAETVQPTEAQKKAGNYKTPPVKINGMRVRFETAKGEERSGTDEDGNEWSVKMANDYGYFEGMRGADKDKLDVIVGRRPHNVKLPVHVIDQINPKTGEFDEHKVVVGEASIDDALATYNANYQKGWQGAGSVTAMSWDEFKARPKKWPKKPLGDLGLVKPAQNMEVKEGAEVEAPRLSAKKGAREKIKRFRSYGAEVIGDKVVLYRGADVPKSTIRALRYNDYLSAAEGDTDATGNGGAASYGKNVVRFELPVDDVEVTGAGEFQYTGTSKSLKGGAKYPLQIYRAYNDVYGSNYTAEQIDQERPEEVREVASMGLSGGREEFDALVGAKAKPAPKSDDTPRMKAKSAKGKATAPEKKTLPDTLTIDGVKRPTRNSEGRPIHPTEEGVRNFWAWFGDSKVVDADGQPLVVYHGGGGGITVFDPARAGTVQASDWGKGIYLTPSKWMAEGYRDDANKAADKESEAIWDEMERKAREFGTRVMYESIDLREGRITQEQYDTLQDIDRRWRAARAKAAKDGGGEVYALYAKIENPEYEVSGSHTDPFLAERAKSNGKDGIIVRFEDGGIDEIVVFSPNQIKSATGNRGTFGQRAPTAAEAERLGLSEAEAREAQEAGDIRFKLKSPEEQERDLVVLHNITARELRQSADLGGLAVPSIAITRAGETFDGFGDITLVGSSDMIDPADRRNEVYETDAYSPTFPRVRRKVNMAKLDAALYTEAFKQYRDEYRVGDTGTNPLALVRETIEKDESLDNFTLTADDYLSVSPDREFLRYAFLREQGVDINVPTLPDSGRSRLMGYPGLKTALRKIKRPEDIRDTPSRDLPDTEYARKLGGVVRNAIDAHVDALARANNTDRAFWDDVRETLISSEFDEAGRWHFGPLDRLITDHADLLNGSKFRRVDNQKLSKRINRAFRKQDREAYNRWLEERFGDAIGEAYLEDGRKRVEPTLENIVKVMTKGRTSANGGGMFFGLGESRALSAKRFKSLQQIQKARDEIKGKAEQEKAAEEVKEAFFEWQSAIRPYYQWDSSFDALDDASKALGQFGKGAKTKANMGFNLARNDYKNVPDELLEQGVALSKAMLSVPVEYFEAKPQRAVRLNEFVGAVVPRGKAYDDTVALLRQNGITRIRRYKKGDAESRRQAVARFEDVMFKIGHHGTPHRWPPEPGFPYGRPRLDKIGTGEGAGAYGWGFYHADENEVAGSYQRSLSGRIGPGSRRPADDAHVKAARNFLENGYTPEETLAGLQEAYPEASAEDLRIAIHAGNPGALYTLDVPDADLAKYLDWDVPLSKQPEVLAALRGKEFADIQWPEDGDKLGDGVVRVEQDPDLPEFKKYYLEIGKGKFRLTEEDIRRNFGDPYADKEYLTGAQFYTQITKQKGDQKSASEHLRDLGIPGLKYLDQGSRAQAPYIVSIIRKADGVTVQERVAETRSKAETIAKEMRAKGMDAAIKDAGTRNYVTWDQDVLDRSRIVAINGEPVEQPTAKSRSARTATSDAGLSLDAVKRWTSTVAGSWANTPGFNVVERVADLPAPITQAIRDQGYPESDVHAVYWNGEVHIVASNLPTQRALEEAVFHEVYGHYGARELFGDEYMGQMDRLFNLLGGVGGLRRLAAKHDLPMEAYFDNMKYQAPEHRKAFIVDEFLAHMQETRVRQSVGRKVIEYVQNLIGILRNWLRTNGFVESAKMSDSELVHLLRKMERTVTGGKRHALLTEAQAKAFAKVDTAGAGAAEIEDARKEWAEKGTDSKYFRKWFGDSKVVDENGDPLVVYHGTRAREDFSEFSVDGPPLEDEFGGRVEVGSGADMTAYMGAHFAEAPTVAQMFATGVGKGNVSIRPEGPGRIIPVYLSIENPYETTERALRDRIYSSDLSGVGSELQDAIQEMIEDSAEADGLETEAVWKQYDENEDFRRNIHSDVLSNAQETYEDGGQNIAAEVGAHTRDLLEREGYDGVYYENQVEGGFAYIAFRPNQIKSAIGNRGTFSPDTGNILLSQRAPTFYSQMTRVLTERLPKKGGGASYAQQIRKLAEKSEFKRDEMEWSGVIEWLGEQKGTLTREDVMDYVRGQEVRVEEVQSDIRADDSDPYNIGFSHDWIPDIPADDFFEMEARDIYMDEARTIIAEREDIDESEVEEAEALDEAVEIAKEAYFSDPDRVAQYRTYTAETEGGDSAIFILNDADGGLDLWPKDGGGESIWEGTSFDEDAVKGAITEYMDRKYPGQKSFEPKYSEYTLPGGENYREVLLTLPPAPNTAPSFTEWMTQKGYDMAERDSRVAEYQREHPPKDKTQYQSSHWDEPNVLAHLRLNDRTDAEGRRVLFIEEVQSDWAQEGRKRGFNAPGAEPTVTIEEVSNETFNVYADGELYFHGTSREQAEQAAERARSGATRVPDMPFKSTIKGNASTLSGWAGLAMKRAIRMAAEGGYDAIAWTTGEQQAERYSLDKVVDYISADKRGDKILVRTSNVEVDRQIQSAGNGDPYTKGGGGTLMTEAQIETVFGKDYGERILQAANEEGGGMLEGDGLKLGGEGMRAFYDEMLPTAVNKYVKKWGTKVEQRGIQAPRYGAAQAGNGDWKVQRDDGASVPVGWLPDRTNVAIFARQVEDNRVALYESEAAAKRDAERLNQNPPYNKDSRAVDGHVLPLTDAMRDSALRGLPMFKVSGAQAAMSAASEAARKRPTVKQFLTDPKYVKGFLRDRRPATLSALTLRHLADVARNKLPEIQDYMRVADRMFSRRGDLVTNAHEIIKQWDKLKGAASDNVAWLMHHATLAGVDPSEDYAPIITKETAAKELAKLKDLALKSRNSAKHVNAANEVKKRLAFEKNRKAAYPELRKEWEALPEEAKELYRTVRDFYAARFDATLQALENRLNRAEMDDNTRKAAIAKIRQHFESAKVNGPYFPLARFGDNWVSVRDAAGNMIGFEMFERSEQARDFVKRMESEGYQAKLGKSIENVQELTGVPETFIKDILEIVGSKETAYNAQAVSEMKDAVYQLYLTTLPDSSLRKNFIHRKKTAGFSSDAKRAFAKQSFHGAYQLARLEYADVLTQRLEDTRGALKDSEDPQFAADVFNEFQKRHAWVMNPKSAKWANSITGLGFAWYLGVTPAAALVNTSQVPLVTLPVMAAEFGWGESMKQLMRASKEYFAGGAKMKPGEWYDIEKHLEKVAAKGGQRATEELQAFRELENRGVIDRTLTHDLIGRSETESEVYSPGSQKFMGVVGWTFHHAERFNREVSAVAAYRLARKRGLTHQQAVEKAAKITWDTHFDYSNANRARFMQSDWAKVFLMFRQFSLNMSYLLVVTAKRALVNADPVEKKLAQRQITGLLGMHAVAAGALGLPLIWTVQMITEALFDDEDEPWDFEIEFRNWAHENLGETGGRALTEGLFNAIPGGPDISSRVSLNDLWLRGSGRDLQAEDTVMYWVEQAAGPALGMVTGAARGYQLINEGQPLRGIEYMMPKVFRDVFKAARYAREGVTTQRGDPLVDEVTATEILFQAQGFTPANIARQYEANRGVRYLYDRIRHRRQLLMNRFALATFNNDAGMRADTIKEIQRFNRKNPRNAISVGNLTSSLKNRRRYSSQALHGISLPKSYKHLTSQVTFGN